MNPVSEKNEELLISIKNLSVFLKNSVDHPPLINDLSLQINKNQKSALIGQSGCGKTITALALLGLLPKDMEAVCEAYILNKSHIDINNEQSVLKLRGREIAMIFQEPHDALNPVFKTGTQMVDVIKANLNLSGKKAKSEALHMLSQAGFSDAAQIYRMYPGQLSGGMAQRVVIAMALSCRPKLIIADEPTSALDAVTQNKILNLIFDLQRKFQFALLLISHDISLVKKYVDNMHIMKEGRMLFSGPVQDLTFPNPDPYIQSLFETLPALD